MNKVQLIGRVTKDIEVAITASEKRVAGFTLAVDRRKKDDGTDFISCVAWNKTAEILGKHVHKGNRVAICGRLQTRKYEDKNGNTKNITEVIVDEVEFLERKQTENDEN